MILASRESVVKASEILEIQSAIADKKSIRGLRLQTTDGKDLGKVEDFQLDEKTGLVEGYILDRRTSCRHHVRALVPSDAVVDRTREGYCIRDAGRGIHSHPDAQRHKRSLQAFRLMSRSRLCALRAA